MNAVECGVCRVAFIPRTNGKYCSDLCRHRALADRAKAIRDRLGPLFNERRAAWRKTLSEEDRERYRGYRRAHGERNRVAINISALARYHRIRNAAIDAYGAVCRCCGETTREFLAIDHVEGGGGKHRKALGGGYSFYTWLRKQDYPEGFQILCHNCNMAKQFSGMCPHERDRDGS